MGFGGSIGKMNEVGAKGMRATAPLLKNAPEAPSYIYSYPSKRAYRRPPPGLTLESIWKQERSGHLNVYLHIPFCAYRCSFCTLFVTTKKDADLRREYIKSLVRQIKSISPVLSASVIDSLYIGGGTPTTLGPAEFDEIVQAVRQYLPPLAADAEFSVEGSPDSFTPDIVNALRSLGVNRVSMGIQTTDPDELKLVGRPYDPQVALDAMDRLVAAKFPAINFDLIYGLSGQTRDKFAASLQSVIQHGPNTLTLYPIVARPLTPIFKSDRTGKAPLAKQSLLYDMYDDNVETLANEGFTQESTPRFTKLPRGRGYWQEFLDFSGVPVLALGEGARGYTGSVHYATFFPIRARAVNSAIQDFTASDHDPGRCPDLAYILSPEEQFRRYIILNLSLGQVNFREGEERFVQSSGIMREQIELLLGHGLARMRGGDTIVLTAAGFKYCSAALSTLKSRAVLEYERTYVQE